METETSRQRSKSPRGRASDGADGAPPRPKSILRNKTAGPRNKSPGRLVGMIVGAKRAIEEDLRRPMLLPSPPGGSKAGWLSRIKPADQVELSERATDREGVDGIDGDAAESVEEPPENAEEMIAGTSAAPTEDEMTPRYISVSEEREDLSPIQDIIRNPDDAVSPSEAGPSEELRTDEMGTLYDDECAKWEPWTESEQSKRSYGCGDQVLTDAMFWGEEARQAFARVLETLADCASPAGKVSASDVDECVAVTGDSKEEATASTDVVESLCPEMEASEECRGATETRVEEDGSREDTSKPTTSIQPSETSRNGGALKPSKSRKTGKSRAGNKRRGYSLFSFKSRKLY